MSQLYENRQIRELEQLAITSGIEEYLLMQRAGQAAFTLISERWREIEKIIVCTGKGNNAGDGYEVARLAYNKGLQVVVYTLCDPDHLLGSAKTAAKAAKETGVQIVPYTPDLVFDADLVVDALLGSGLQGEVKEPYAALINQINDQNGDVLALDVPSGLDIDTGCIHGAAVDADVTITFIGLKKGLYTRKGPGRSGDIILNTLDIPQELFDKVSVETQVIDWDRVKTLLPRRARDAHKGEYGHVLVIGGDYGMGGAVRMAAEAALRVGAGLVSVATRPEHVPVVSTSRPEIMCHQVADADELLPMLERATVVVIGPGLGRSPWAEALLQKSLSSPVPKLLDADALNLLSENPCHCSNWILTPHPGEAARLLGESCQNLQLNRFAAVDALQKKYGGVVVLKGAGTLIRGDASITHICRAGNPGMASGGMGDILSGIIGGFVAQGLSLFDAADAGVYVHARAGDLAVECGGGERGLLATDVFAHMRKLVNPN